MGETCTRKGWPSPILQLLISDQILICPLCNKLVLWDVHAEKRVWFHREAGKQCALCSEKNWHAHRVGLSLSLVSHYRIARRKSNALEAEICLYPKRSYTRIVSVKEQCSFSFQPNILRSKIKLKNQHFDGFFAYIACFGWLCDRN